MPHLVISSGRGPLVEGDPCLFAMVATGRADPAALGLDETVDILA